MYVDYCFSNDSKMHCFIVYHDGSAYYFKSKYLSDLIGGVANFLKNKKEEIYIDHRGCAKTLLERLNEEEIPYKLMNICNYNFTNI